MQAVVVQWMARQLDRLPWTADRWAREAGLAPTTVTRAMSPKYQSISSVTTLHALARAAGVPSILDFLEVQTVLTPRAPITTEILRELLPTVGCKVSEENLVYLSEALVATLAGMSEQKDKGAVSDPELARKIARAVSGAIRHRLLP